MNVLQQRSYLRDRQRSLSELSSARIRLADIYPLADQLQQRKFQPRPWILSYSIRTFFLAAISLCSTMQSEDRGSIDEVAVVLAMAAMTTALAGLPWDAANTTVPSSPGVSCPCGEQWGIMGMIRRVVVTPQRANRYC